jgi:hypothetical protein
MVVKLIVQISNPPYSLSGQVDDEDAAHIPSDGIDRDGGGSCRGASSGAAAASVPLNDPDDGEIVGIGGGIGVDRPNASDDE